MPSPAWFGGGVSCPHATLARQVSGTAGRKGPRRGQQGIIGYIGRQGKVPDDGPIRVSAGQLEGATENSWRGISSLFDVSQNRPLRVLRSKGSYWETGQKSRIGVAIHADLHSLVPRPYRIFCGQMLRLPCSVH